MGGMKCANLSRGAHKRVRVYRRFIMNKEELVKEISKKTKLSQKVSSDVLSATLEIIQKTVAKGKKVTLVGFGTFSVVEKAERMGINPATKESITIKAKKAIKFKAGAELSEEIQ